MRHALTVRASKSVALIVAAMLRRPGDRPARRGAPRRRSCAGVLAYSKEHFHGVTAHLPDGTKCLEPASTARTVPASPARIANTASCAAARLEEI